MSVEDTPKISKRVEESEETAEAILKRLDGYVEIIENNSDEAKAMRVLLTDSPEKVALPHSITKERLREELERLQQEKEALLSRLGEAMEFLNSTPVGLNAPLMDNNGFPRGDCDLYAIRTARNTVNCSRNSLTTIDEQLAEKMQLFYLLTREEGLAQMEKEKASIQEKVQLTPKELERRRQMELYEKDERRALQLEPFLVVEQVAERSPAWEAGISPGLRIAQFGDITTHNFFSRGGLESLRDVVEESSKRNGTISVWARPAERVPQRGEDEKVRQYLIAPMSWEGQGKLGCRFVLCTNSASSV